MTGSTSQLTSTAENSGTASAPSTELERIGDAPEPASYSFTVLWVVLLVANIIPIWIVDYFPAQNGPWFLATVQIFKEISNPELGYGEYYERSWFPIPHMLFHAGVLLMSLVMPLQIAEKIALTISASLVPLSVLCFLSVVAPGRRALGLLGFLMIYSYPFLRGYNNFSLSIPMFFFTFGYWIRHRESSRPQKYVVLGVLSVLLYLSHLIGILLLCCCIGWYQLRKGTGWWVATRSAVAATVCAWPLVIAYLTLNSQSSEWITHEDTEWQPLHWTIQYFFERYFMTVSTGAFAIAVAAWLWVPGILFLSARARSGGFWRACREIAFSPLGSLALVLLVSFLVLPDHIIGWHKFNQRLIPFILAISIGAAAVALPKSVYLRLRRPLQSTVTLAALVVPVLIGRQLVAMDGMLQQYTAAIDKVAPRSRVLPLLYENPAFGLIRPLTRAHEYYLIERGGGNPGGIATMNTLSIVWYRHYPVADTFPRYRDDMSDSEFATMLESYDNVLIWSDQEKTIDQRLETTDFRVLHDQGALRLYGRS